MHRTVSLSHKGSTNQGHEQTQRLEIVVADAEMDYNIEIIPTISGPTTIINGTKQDLLNLAEKLHAVASGL